MLRATVPVAVAALSLTTTGFASAAPEGGSTAKGPREVVTVVIDRDGADASRALVAARPFNPRVPKPPTLVVGVELRVAPDGSRCAYIFPTAMDPNSRDAGTQETRAVDLARQYGTCPNSPRQPNGGLTPAAAAALIWQDRVELPDPVLAIKPGHAVTGKPAYLEVTSPRTIRMNTTAFGHAVELTVTSVLDIDWGDGTLERNVTRQGGPWPHGDITHVYTDTQAEAPVHVTQRWKASWRVGNQTGVIADQLFTESTLLLPVREIQAVRER